MLLPERCCARLLLWCLSLAFCLLPARAASCPPASGSRAVAICSPANGAIVQSPIPFSCDASDPAPLAALQLYVDGKLTDQVNTAALQMQIAAAPGGHQLVCKGWDNAGPFSSIVNVSVVSPPPPGCGQGLPNRTVEFCSPSANASVSSPVTVSCASEDTNPIAAMQVYLDGKLVYQTPNSFIDTMLAIPNGVHQIACKGWDQIGSFLQIENITLVSQVLTVNPAKANLSEGDQQQFTASMPVSWKASCGSVSTAGLFTAPLAPATCVVTATATGSTQSANSPVAVSAPFSVSPPSADTQLGKTQQFTANASAPVNWSASCGTIDANGLYTATAAGRCAIIATSTGSVAYTAQALETVVIPGLNYTTWKNDNMRTGQQLNETILTPANVAGLQQKFNVPMDGQVFAQPLYVSNLFIGSVEHNVLYVATENDSVYALDADSGAQLWKDSFLANGVTTASSSVVQSSVQPKIGITGTPVIDLSTGTLYVAALTLENSGTQYVYRLHAIDIVSGTEKFGGPVQINTSGFNAERQLQRPGLLLVNGNIYVAFGSQDDVIPWHGWLFSYNAGTLMQESVWNSTPGGNGGGIWSGSIAADADGNLFVTTGNGDFDGVTQFGSSAVKLSPSLQVLDFFTPFNNAMLTQDDSDLVPGGVLLLPDQIGQFPHEMIVCGKPTPIYVINRDGMGKVGISSDNIIQRLNNEIGGSTGIQASDKCFMTPALWQQNLYFIGNNDVLKQFTLNSSTGLLSSTPVMQNTFIFAFPGAQPVVSANGNSNGIVWAIEWTTATLRAYDATDVSRLLYAYSGPSLGMGNKFTVPTVINGKVYIGTQHALVGFGLP